jgi:outer membrane murein-binding lipoprotein Lpp
MKRTFGLTITAISLAGLLLVGCSSDATEEELQQLEALKAEVTSLEKELASTQSELDNLKKAIAEKDTQLKKCAEDKAAAEKALKGM